MHELSQKMIDVQAILGKITGVGYFHIVTVSLQLYLVDSVSDMVACQLGLEAPNVVAVFCKLWAETVIDVHWIC